MHYLRWLPVPLIALIPLAFATPSPRTYSSHSYYVLHHNAKSHMTPSECAHALGAQLVEQVGELDDHWLVRIEAEPPAGDNLYRRDDDELIQRLNIHKRSPNNALASSVRSLTRQVPRQRIKKRAPPHSPPSDLVPTVSSSSVVASKLGIKDPIFPDQWHNVNDKFPGFDLNVSGVWEMGITGKGVISAVVDDGLDANSKDLADNFNREGSWDYNDHGPLPLPRLSDDRHGTRCSGEIAAVKNDVCGVGVAYDSKIAGIRILSGPISDADEAAALNWGYHKTSIYSCSWGPPDNGEAMEAPGPLIQRAIVNGVQKGRQGKGSIFVFASGNGAGSGDQCNFDGYTNSIYSVTVAAIDNKGKHPYYSEPCAANMIVAYSSGGGNSIWTTDVGEDKCTSGHGGTSAAAPLAVGVFALALQIRPDLTWRDIQYLCLRSALQINPNDPDWEMTAAGRPYSYKYGYGALDAWTYVKEARDWPLVKPQAWMEIADVVVPSATINQTADGDVLMDDGDHIGPSGVTSNLFVTSGNLTANNFEMLEHVTIRVWIRHTKRGDVEVTLTSPNGIKSILAQKRTKDRADTGFPGWTFMSLKHWGENPVGKWTIEVKDQANPTEHGFFLAWGMSFWGSSIDPSKAKPWQFPDPDEVPDIVPEPPISVAPTSTSSKASATKTYAKPTDHLPPDHDVAEGDAGEHSMTSSTVAPTSSPKPDEDVVEPNPSMTPTPDEGTFSHMYDLLSNQTWLIGAFGTVAVFIIGAGVFFWKRRSRRRNAEYSSVSQGEDHPMASIGDQAEQGLLGRGRGRRGRGTKELYDAFGEPEEGASDGEAETAPLRYHDGFLDDEDHHDAGDEKVVQVYRDEPEAAEEGKVHEASREGSSPGSADGSWEHASDVPRP